jgi:hypothetical protein
MTRKMRLEFGPTITRWPLTKALPLPPSLVKTGTVAGTTWPGSVTPAKPARWPSSGGRRYAPVAPIEGLDCIGDVLRSDPTLPFTRPLLQVRTLDRLKALLPKGRHFVFLTFEEPNLAPRADRLAALKAENGAGPNDILHEVTVTFS